MPLVKLAGSLEKMMIRNSYVTMKNFSITVMFEHSVLQLQTIRFFRKWHIFSQTSRALIKKMMKAERHWQEAVKRRVLRGFRHRECGKREKLAWAALTRYVRKRKVKNVLKLRAHRFRNLQLVAKAFGHYRQGIEMIKPLNERKKILNNMATEHNQQRAVCKAIKSWKLYTYRLRVAKYLRNKHQFATLSKAFTTYRDIFIQQHSESMLVSQASNNYENRLMSKAMMLLAQYSSYKAQRKQVTMSARIFFFNALKGKVVRKLA